MEIENICQSNADRRRFLQTLGAAGLSGAAMTLGSSAAAAQSGGHAQPLHGMLGAKGAGPGRPKIAMLVHPKMVLQDLVGPLTVFNIMHSEIHLVWKTLDPVMSEVGIAVTPSTTLRDCPEKLDVLFAPGGLGGTLDMMDDPEVVEFFAHHGKSARYVTSDCTGSLLLGAAGLLRGYRAASHWTVRELVALMGGIPSSERVCIDRNRITGGGVTAGIDFALTLASLLRSPEEAQAYQLTIEYAPEPPFNAGRPDTAPAAITERITASRAAIVARAREKSRIAGEKLRG